MDINRKKIIYFVSSSLNLGGAEIQCVALANKLSKEGFEVKFYSLKFDNILKSKISNNIRVREFKIYSITQKEKQSLGTVYWWIRSVLQLRADIRNDLKNNHDISIISFMYHSWITSFFSSLFMRKVKNIIAIRNSKMASRGNKTKIFRLISYIFIGNLSKYVVFNSQIAYHNLGKYIFRSNTKVIKNLLIEPQESIDKQTEKKILNSKSKYNIVSVGRLDKLKNYQKSIHLFNKLIERGLEASYFIFGSGDELSNLKLLVKELKIQERVIFMGRIIEPQLYFQNFDLLLQTSMHESFPNSIVEALNENLFVVTTDVGDIKFLLKDNRGLLLESDHEDVIFNNIISYLRFGIQNKTDSKEFIKNFLNNQETVSNWIKLIDS